MEQNKIKLDFAVDGVSIYEDFKDKRFIKARINCFSDGANSHTNPVSLEALQKSSSSIYDIPIIAEYHGNDFGGHGIFGKQFSFGFVKESKDNPITFTKREDGRTTLTIIGTIWRKYCDNVLDIFSNNKNKKNVSVEMSIIDFDEKPNGKIDMKQFVFEAITVLSNSIAPACKGSNIELQFANDKKEYLQEMEKLDFEIKSKIDIDNSKESAAGGQWSNPRQKLLNPILKASNKTALLNEGYLIWKDEGEEGVTLSDVHYPHHVVRNGKFVLHKRGVIAAFQRAAAQGIVSGDVKNHILRHYRELGLSQENFSEFDLTEQQYNEYFSEMEDDNSVAKLNNTEKEIEKDVNNKPENEDMACKDKMTSKEDEDMACKGKMEEDSKLEDDGECEDEDIAQLKKDYADLQLKYSALDGNYQKLNKDNETCLAKLQLMSDYKELKEFKEEVMAQRQKEKQISEMEAVFTSIEGKGIEMSDENKNQLKERISEFTDTTAWGNYVKAFAFDNLSKEIVLKNSDENVADIASLNRKNNENDVWGEARHSQINPKSIWNQ